MSIRILDANGRGTDYVVGDVHGLYSQLMRGLDRVRFDPTQDRLIAVGDLVNHGPESPSMIRLLREPWFHSTRGNHEQHYLRPFFDSPIQSPEDRDTMVRLGMGWWLSLDEKERAEAKGAFAAMPIAIEIADPDCHVGIVHADVPPHMSWDDVREFLLDAPDSSLPDHTIGSARPIDSCHGGWNNRKRTEHYMLYSRQRFRSMDERIVSGVDYVFVGHTVVKSPMVLGNVFHIDTGAVYRPRPQDRKITPLAIKEMAGSQQWF